MVIPCIALLLLILPACGDDDEAAASDGVSVSDAWSRATVLLEDAGDHEMDADDADATAGEAEMDSSMDMSGTNGVIYMMIENAGDENDTLLSATTDVSEAAELHAVNMVEGVMQMRQVEGGIEVPAGETVTLESGGLHIMLIGLNQSLEAGDTFVVELEFELAGSMTVDVEIREP